MRWEFLKFEIRMFSIHYSISRIREREDEKITLENKTIITTTRF